ncbi:MAG: MBL fold metallo-hydrolase [Bacteroidota bacterium]
MDLASIYQQAVYQVEMHHKLWFSEGEISKAIGLNGFMMEGLLIDTGQVHMQKEIREVVGAHPIEQVFLTHHHEDHSGNLAMVKQTTQAPIYASPDCIELMKAPPPISLAQKLTWGDRPPFTELIPKANCLETPNHRFQLIPVPGHAKDMVALYDPERAWLFSADAWVSPYIKYFMRPESMAEQIQTLERLGQLAVEVLFCSHNPKLSGGQALLKQKQQFLEDFYGRVVQEWEKGKSVPAIRRAMGRKENLFLKCLSGGELSLYNMIASVIRDEEKQAES